MKYLLLFLLISCADSTVTPEVFKRAEELCKNNEGVKEIDLYERMFKVHCNNGAVFRQDRK